MDPNETLRELRDLIKQWRNAEEVDDLCHHGDDMADRVEALDEWLSSGGFLPDAWKRGQ